MSSFRLDWYELPVDLQQQKIDEYITNCCEAEGLTDQEKDFRLTDNYERQNAEESIKRYFPVYF